VFSVLSIYYQGRKKFVISKKMFGRTGHESTRVIFGAAALGRANQAEADQVLELLLQYGINHIDTASTYGDSEVRIGPWLKHHRAKFFLATKARERSYTKARDEIHRSLGRLRVDYVDLLQLHNLVDQIEWQTALGKSGALEAALEAQQQGLVRFIGVTGHGLSIAAMHQKSLTEFDFDSVLLPYNYITYQNAKYSADFETLAAMCQTKNVAVQTIKSIARKPWGINQTRTNTTWYEPLTEQSEIDLAVSWVLSRPEVFLNTVGDISLLPKVFAAAEKFEATRSQAEIGADLANMDLVSLFV
jgi:predicted aldo/keto reductase-like oxidoreductase